MHPVGHRPGTRNGAASDMMLALVDSGVRAPAPSATERAVSPRVPLAVSLTGLAVLAFALRALEIVRQSAFMDEAAQIMAGRLLIEQHVVYAGILKWNYGSYLWPLVAGSADILGGLTAVRAVTAVLGAVMALATAVTAARLAPPAAGPQRRWTGALIAGLIMAISPTAIGIGRIGTYDSLAGAAFMSGMALLMPIRPGRRGPALLAAALLLFIGFLAKYVLAVFFPILCLYAMVGARSRGAFIRGTLWFVLPLAACCALYFIAFRAELTYLLHFSTGYTDLKSGTPLREYVGQRLDVWVLAAVALYGVRRATRTEWLVGLGGTGVMLGFQAVARPDFDFWKHSIYLVFFLAPLAGIALAPVAWYVVAAALAGLGWREATGTERVVARGLVLGLIAWQIKVWAGSDDWNWQAIPFWLLAPLAGLVLAAPAALPAARLTDGRGRAGCRLVAIALVIGALAPLPLMLAEAHARPLVTFYPNLNTSVDAIRTHSAGSRRVLADDSAIRYYLHRQLPSYQQVTDPFFITYRDEQDMTAYELAITDRYFDAIVLDGGIGPLGRRIRAQLGDLIARNYNRVYLHRSGDGTVIEIYQAREIVAEAAEIPAVDGPNVTYFDDGIQGWGAHPDNAELRPGLQVAISSERTWNGHPSLQFTPTGRLSLAGMTVKGPVSEVQMDVYITPSGDERPVLYLGMIGFDKDWQWRDDGFTQPVPTGRWIRITWDLSRPGFYNEIGLKLPDGATNTVYLGRVEIQP
jgi:hypothetical protein